MKTKHPIFKAYKDGELIQHQEYAIHSNAVLNNPYLQLCSTMATINPKWCDDLRLYTGLEDCHGEPIYEGDTLWRETNRFYSDYMESIVVMDKGEWRIEYSNTTGFDRLYSMCAKLSLTPPKQERRVKQRREKIARRLSSRRHEGWVVIRKKEHCGRSGRRMAGIGCGRREADK